jgi:hypothetical protein
MRILDQPRDVRVEVGGMWSRGFCITDKRGESPPAATVDDNDKVIKEPAVNLPRDHHVDATAEAQVVQELGGFDEIEAGCNLPGDHGGWTSPGRGNRIYLADHTFDGWKVGFGEEMLKRILGLKQW